MTGVGLVSPLGGGLHSESVRDFGAALQRLVTGAYPTADPDTQDLLAGGQFIMRVGSGDLRVSLRSAEH